jgi:hypothetical protein
VGPQTLGALNRPATLDAATAPSPASHYLQMGSRGAAVLTNEYEIASELAFNGLSPLIVGSAPQVAQWRMWNASPIPARALVLTFLPIARTPGFERLLEHAFARVSPGPTLRYTFAGTSEGTFYSTWCSRPVRDAAVILYGRFNDL